MAPTAASTANALRTTTPENPDPAVTDERQSYSQATDQGVRIRLPRRGQFSPAADNPNDSH
jgi:hypothetical protein